MKPPDVGAIIAVSALVLVATALVGAGLYALFWKPKSHEGRRRQEHIVHGFQLGGGVVLGILLMGSLVSGSQIAFGIIEPPGSLSRTAALFIALASLLLIFSMIRYWAKYVAGWVGYSVLNGLHMATTGHLLNNPSILVPRWWSLSLTALAFASALVSVRFAKDDALKAADKAALMVWLLAFTAAVDVESTRTLHRDLLGLSAMLAGTLALIAAFRYRRGSHRHRVSRRRLERSVERSHL